MNNSSGGALNTKAEILIAAIAKREIATPRNASKFHYIRLRPYAQAKCIACLLARVRAWMQWETNHAPTRAQRSVGVISLAAVTGNPIP
jgi:hypothetical protein